MKNYKICLLFASVVMLSAQMVGCKKQEVFTYNTKNALWFESRIYDKQADEWLRLDTVMISATYFPGMVDYTHKFKINLIGTPLTQAKEYNLALVDSLSQNDALQYISVPTEAIFSANTVVDTLRVVIYINKIPQGYKGYVTYRLVPNESFMEGYAQNNFIKVWVNNVPTKPLWWTLTIEQSYLGKYSKKKFEEFIKFSGRLTLEGIDPFIQREICRGFKQYIADNNITEEDGSPMIIPIY